MELTLASALSPGALVGHLAYVLLVVSMMMRRMVLLRILVIVSALVAIAYAVVWLGDPVSAFWETLLVTVNVVQLLITWRRNSRARFTAEERAFADRRLRGLSPGDQRALLDLGTWTDLPPGAVLTREGEVPDALWFVTGGRARIRANGREVASCGPGAYVGEMSLVGGSPASATAEAAEPTRAWCITRSALDRLDQKRPTWLAVIEAGIARDMRNKLVSANAAGPG